MTAVKDSTFAGATVKYNGVQFGGSEAAFDSLPPTFELVTNAVYDEAGRAVVNFRHILTVDCIFFADNESTLSANLQSVRRRLLTPGRQLSLDGIALGFNEDEPDIIFGPKPISFSTPTTHGVIACQTRWVCEFTGAPCIISGSASPAFSAFNYSTTWANDFEGQTIRTIVGYYTVAQTRSQGKFGKVSGSSSASKASLTRTADLIRTSAIIELPEGFKRTQNTWVENAAKDRMDFTVIDQSMRGRAYPPGISEVTNDKISMSTSPLTFSQAEVNMSATMTVAPDRAPSLAGVYFLQWAIARQTAMTKRLKRKKGKAAVIPTRFAMETGLCDGSRTTSFFMAWKTTGCIQDLFFNTPWEPLPNTDYKKWRRSMEPVWNNRGVPLLAEVQNEDAVFSICDNVTGSKIGKGNAADPDVVVLDRYAYPCPDIDQDNSWLDYDVQVSVYRQEKNSIVRRAVIPFASAAAPIVPLGAAVTTAVNMVIGSRFDSGEDTEHIVVQDGIPVQWVLVQAKGRRVKFNPVFPKLETIGPNNAKVRPVGSAVIERKIVAKFGNCEIRQMRGYQWYVVLDYVSDFGEKFNPVVCQTTRSEKDGPSV